MLVAVRFAIVDQKKVKFSHDKLLPDNAKGSEANEPRYVSMPEAWVGGSSDSFDGK